MGLQTELSSDELQAKLEYINMRWGVDEQYLTDFFSSPEAHEVLKPMSRNARKKFTRHLRSLDQGFACMRKMYPIEDRFEKADHPFFRDYHAEIRKRVGDKQFLQYLSGDWNDEILSAVNVAQKTHMVHRDRTKSEQHPRVRFTPRSSYSSLANR
jgi:hypothetical protein